MPQYVAVQTPRPHNTRELDDDVALETTEQQQNASEQRLQLERMRYRAQLDLRRMQSNMSSYAHDIDSARSVARVYEPSVRERTRTALEGRWGICLELTNFALSVLIFSMYIAELYDDDLNESMGRRYIEIFVTSFFVFDLALHLFVAPSLWHYLLSPHGVIDLLTIVPSLIVFLVPATRSQLFFVLRVLRIFRALRVLRLKQFLRFKKSKFDYELAVFILSSVAVILCAAGMFHALEESYYISMNQTLRFHEALYFVLVTTATIGYGDISPRTTMGQVFVIVLILGIFTIVPHEVSKLNALAKQTHEYDKDYSTKTKSSGHVIVAGDELSTDAVLAFLHEFYHASRGNIHLDVVFLSDAPPAPELARILATKTYRWRACYLRGDITNSSDQRRVQLESATAVFLLATKRLQGDSAAQDATTVLHALSVRNVADSTGQLIDIYTQLLSHRAEHTLASRYLGAHPTTASTLQNLILARTAVCPGASTLMLNLLQSVDVAEYSKHVSWRKLWIQEYLDGMCHQLFPMVFTNRFALEKFEDVARNVYEHYGAILVTVYDKRVQRHAHRESPSAFHSVASGSSVPLAPFQSYIYEGDIGFVIAKSASVVLHIVNTYGHWRGDASGERMQASSTNVLPVRVCSDTLLRRPAPHSSFRASTRALDSALRDELSTSATSGLENARMGIRERKWREHHDDLVIATDAEHVPVVSAAAPDARMRVVHPQANGMLHSIDEGSAANTSPQSQARAHGTRVMDGVRTHDAAQVLDALQREHFRVDTQHMTDHYVVCAGALSEALELIHSLRSFYQYEQHLRFTATTMTRPAGSHLQQAQQLSVRTSHRHFVLLVPTFPDAHTIMRVLRERDDSSENVLESIYFVTGSSSKASDLTRTGAPRARYVVVLPVEASAAARHGASPSEMTTEHTNSDANLADFGVISSMLAVEISRQQSSALRRGGSVSPRRRRLSSRTLSADVAIALKGLDVTAPSYQREVNQGLPVESVKLRMLERFPDLDATVFREPNDVIDARLHDQLDAKHSSAGEHARSGTSHDAPLLAVENNTLGVLEHAINARFCRPRDPEVCHDEFPYLAPSFASGNVFLASLLDRIVCQSFYNPYITDLVVSLAAGSPVTPSVSSGAAPTSSFRGARPGFDAASRRRRLFRIHVDAVFVGGKFLDVFLELVRLDMLAIAILRSPNATVLENLLPYVYTCPDPETVLHAHDRIFVIG